MSPGAGSRWTLFRPLDLALAAALLALAAFCLPRLASPFGSRAEVSVNGKPVARLSLDGPLREISVATDLGPLRVAYGEGRVRIAEAPCPNRLCVKSGAASRAGSSLLCLPCKVRVEVGGGRGGERDVDAVTF